MKKFIIILFLSPFLYAQSTDRKTHKSIYRIINDPKEAVSIRYSMLKNMDRRLYSSKYIFHKDDAAMASLYLMREKAKQINMKYCGHEQTCKEGADFRLLIDRIGKGFKFTPHEVVLYLAQYGIRFKYYNDFANSAAVRVRKLLGTATKMIPHRLHDKLFITDHEYMLTGGRNIQDAYFDHGEMTYVDRDVFTNKGAAESSAIHFLKFWNNIASTPINSKGLKTRAACVQRYYIFDIDDCFIRMIKEGKKKVDSYESKIKKLLEKSKANHNLVNEILETEKEVETLFVGDKLKANGTYEAGLSPYLYELASNAKKNIIIQTPYFVPSDILFELFEKKLNEGVKIIIHTNSLSSTENNPSWAGYWKYRKKLMEIGPISNKIKLYEYFGDQMNSGLGNNLHGKSGTIDDEIAIIGSYNLDNLSHLYNTEVALFAFDKTKAMELRSSIEEHISCSYQVGLNGNPCTPNACQSDKFGNVDGASDPFPYVDEETKKKMNRWFKRINPNTLKGKIGSQTLEKLL